MQNVCVRVFVACSVCVLLYVFGFTIHRRMKFNYRRTLRIIQCGISYLYCVDNTAHVTHGNRHTSPCLVCFFSSQVCLSFDFPKIGFDQIPEVNGKQMEIDTLNGKKWTNSMNITRTHIHVVFFHYLANTCKTKIDVCFDEIV